MKSYEIPFPARTDSYKLGHFMMYPNCSRMVAYGEFRKSYPDIDDERIVFYGARYITENVLNHKYTAEEVKATEEFCKTHNAGNTPYPFPAKLFYKFIAENDGYFPIKVEMLADGTVIYPHVPVYQITAEEPYAHLVTYLETLLTHIWYPTTVATLSRHMKSIIKEHFDKTVDPENHWKLASRLHDFGYRGCTSHEQAMIGGSAHLLNFEGSDTIAAAYYAQYHLNNGKPVASSIPATEHSVMTSWASEKDAVQHMMDMFGKNELVNQLGIFATVGDSYNYTNFLNKIVPTIAKANDGKFGLWVIRPDSGNPIDCVVEGLKAANKVFGSVVNKKGYIVINHAAIIQGDGIDINTYQRILEVACEVHGYSAENIAGGMGAGLLQKVNRDTMGFATKLSHVTYNTGAEKDLLKRPATDSGKNSLPGVMKVIPDPNSIPKVYPIETEVKEVGGHNLLEVVYDKKPINIKWPLFDEIRQYINDQYSILPEQADPISTQMYHKINNVIKEQGLE